MDEEYYITAGDESTLIKPLTPSVKVAPLSKPDELWEKYKHAVGGFSALGPSAFKSALHEYGELVKVEAVKLCLEVNTDRMPSPSLEGFTVTNSGLGCASVISKMELP